MNPDRSADVPPPNRPALVPAETAEELYELAPCGYLSTLPDGRIVRVNQTFLSWTGYRREDLVGMRRFADLLTAGGRIYHETHYAPMLAMHGAVREIALDLVCADGSRLAVLVNSNAVATAEGTRVIRTSIFDATDRRAYERELLEARQRADRERARATLLARTLQASLLPPSNPEIPGLDVGAAYRPAGVGDQVGGDFYDIFPTGADTWGVVLGDVCGKGTAAAVVTALGRHTVRAAAIRTSSPAEVLRTLNQALLAHESDRFCTALYLTLSLRSDRLEVRVASGGHPAPLVLDGDVRPLAVTGDLLGVLEDPELTDVHLALGPGDALFAYTDGLVEARLGEGFLGEQGLLERLDDHRSLPPSQLPDAVVNDIVAIQDGYPRDDMAAVLVGLPAEGSPTG